jgi:hypothetical protein
MTSDRPKIVIKRKDPARPLTSVNAEVWLDGVRLRNVLGVTSELSMTSNVTEVKLHLIADVEWDAAQPTKENP